MHYCTYKNKLAGIQLEFSNGALGHLNKTCEARDNGIEMHRIAIDWTRPIGAIAVCLVLGCMIKGLRLFDREDQILMEVCWVEDGQEAYWKT